MSHLLVQDSSSDQKEIQGSKHLQGRTRAKKQMY